LGGRGLGKKNVRGRITQRTPQESPELPKKRKTVENPRRGKGDEKKNDRSENATADSPRLHRSSAKVTTNGQIRGVRQ